LLGDVKERPQRPGGVQRIAETRQRPASGARAEEPDERRLARAGLAFHQHEPALTALRPRQEPLEILELRCTFQERTTHVDHEAVTHPQSQSRAWRR
jgi:hypothetical protein